MKLKDIPDDERYSYYQKCEKCGFIHEIRTEEDSRRGYYTQLYLHCDCGEYVHFEIPVN